MSSAQSATAPTSTSIGSMAVRDDHAGGLQKKALDAGVSKHAGERPGVFTNKVFQDGPD
jgi:hypothetical protein